MKLRPSVVLDTGARTMVPTLVLVSRVDVLAKDKVVYSWKKLPEPDWAALRDAAEPYMAARDDLEVAVQAVWKDVLGAKDAPSVRADFYQLGGTSLMMMMVAVAVFWVGWMEASLLVTEVISTLTCSLLGFTPAWLVYPFLTLSCRQGV